LRDTNVISDRVCDPQGRVFRHIRKAGEANVCTSLIVAAELRYGGGKKRSRKLTAQRQATQEAIEVLTCEYRADEVYGSIRAQLEQAGQIIGGNDLRIAAQALPQDLILIADDERKFARINRPSRENWLR
jgi:tRNA(fMet)-specific endonuclease VapC